MWQLFTVLTTLNPLESCVQNPNPFTTTMKTGESQSHLICNIISSSPSFCSLPTLSFCFIRSQIKCSHSKRSSRGKVSCSICSSAQLGRSAESCMLYGALQYHLSLFSPNLTLSLFCLFYQIRAHLPRCARKRLHRPLLLIILRYASVVLLSRKRLHHPSPPWRARRTRRQLSWKCRASTTTTSSQIRAGTAAALLTYS